MDIHSKPKVHEWCKDYGVEYVIDQPGNPPLDRLFKVAIDTAKQRFENTQRAVRHYASSKGCLVLVDAQGRVDTRYIVTTFEQTHGNLSKLYSRMIPILVKRPQTPEGAYIDDSSIRRSPPSGDLGAFLTDRRILRGPLMQNISMIQFIVEE